MEKTYKILKILVLVLAIMVLAVGLWRLLNPVTPEIVVESQERVTLTPTGTIVEPIEEETADLAPDFTVYDIDGNAYKLSDFRGKPVILNFWASWCGPCKAEMPDFEEAYAEYGDEIHFIIVNLTDGRSETLESASAYVESMGYTFPVYYDTDMDAAVTYQISSIPMTCFLDAEGVIVNGQIGMLSAEALQENIDLLLGA